ILTPHFVPPSIPSTDQGRTIGKGSQGKFSSHNNQGGEVGDVKKEISLLGVEKLQIQKHEEVDGRVRE
ncbi:hypothetical protein K439DRAFT_1638547, partial [Ramaria rubella]